MNLSDSSLRTLTKLRACPKTYLYLERKGWLRIADGSQIRAPKGVFHRSESDGSRQKRHILVDRRGAPVTFVIAPAGTHDSQLIFPTLKKFKVFRNKKLLKPEILSLGKAYFSKTIKSNLKKKNIRYRIPNKTNTKNPEFIPKLT
ncbi:transposase [Leptospira noguchii]|uniref:transposase n=1 Tax=Leptospira noguchii TaxID=28182 RepID=UPI0012F650B1|nr:transposase [Leptospira noguchii]